MEPGEALSTAAQVAVALAGFAGVVVAFRTGSVHDWSPLDKFRLRLLLANSILPLTLCLIALLFLAMRPSPAAIWRWCSGFAAALLIPFGLTTMRTIRSFPPHESQSEGGVRFVLSALYVLALAATLAQLYNLAVLNAFWPFFAAIVIQLFAAMFQFVRLILLPPKGI